MWDCLFLALINSLFITVLRGRIVANWQFHMKTG
jgi:hypothetical protein